MLPLMWLIFLILLFPFLFFVLFFQAATFSFTKLGLSPQGAILLFSLSLIGGIINIPVSRRRFVVEEEERNRFAMAKIDFTKIIK